MKKFLCVCLLCFICSAAFADGIDVSALSFDQLVQLEKEITAEIIRRPEFKKVTVPAGVWIIGEDIPEGYYSITAPADNVAIVEACPAGSSHSDFRRVIGAGESVGKELFIAGSIFKTTEAVVLAPPASLGF